MENATIATFQELLDATNYTFQSVTLAGFHPLDRSFFPHAHDFEARAMGGTGYFDAIGGAA
jgi:isocitrate lyase